MSTTEKDLVLARKGRHVALVIAITMLLWLAMTLFIGPALGLPGRFALLFDFAALAGFVYAGVNIYQIWRARQDNDNRR